MNTGKKMNIGIDMKKILCYYDCNIEKAMMRRSTFR